jgi:hypothetical protein
MARASTIYQSSDLSQRGRVVLDTARAGLARLRDNDGLSLVILPEERLSALRTVANCTANYLALEDALASARGRELVPADYGEWTWLRVFDEVDRATFIEEMHDALIVAAREESAELLEETLDRWRTTARVLDDPLRREVLLGTHRDEDFVEVHRPE